MNEDSKKKSVLEKIKFFFKKENFFKQKLVIGLIIAAVCSIVFEYTFYRRIDPQYISKNRMALVAGIFYFIILHGIIRLDVMYEFIHKNRYKLALAFMIFVMIMNYHGSSIVNFDEQFQTNADDRHFHTLLGLPRLIRTDEWASSMLYKLSQGVGDNKYSYFNDTLRGTTTDMFTLVDAPVLDILTIGKPLQLGFIIFGNDAGLSFYWYGKLILMMLGSYELFLILTDQRKRVSLFGMLLITFSSATQWWYCMDTLIWGQLILVLINKFMLADKKWVKYLCAFGLLSTVLAYIFVLYPAWQVPYAYFMLAILIYIVIKNITEFGYRITFHDVVITGFTVLLICLMLWRWYTLSENTIIATMNTDYPGQRQEVGGGSLILYSYIYNIFTPYKEMINPCEISSMLSFYPVPMILSIVYVIRNKSKHLKFFIPTLLVSFILLVFCKWGFPIWLSKASLLSMSTAHRASITLRTLNIYMLVYLFAKSNESKKFFSKPVAYILAIGTTALATYFAREQLIFFLPGLESMLGWLKTLIAGCLFLLAFIGIYNLNRDKYKNFAMIVCSFIAIITGICVNPISRTTDIIYKKPISLKFAEIRESDPDALWLGDDTGWYLNNYMVANGLSTINSTNVYPNVDLYKAVLGEEKAALPENKYIYNRYCHVNINLGKYEENRIYAAAADNIVIELNVESLQDLGIDYIVAKKDLNTLGYSMDFEELYAEDGLYIFRPIYK